MKIIQQQYEGQIEKAKSRRKKSKYKELGKSKMIKKTQKQQVYFTWNASNYIKQTKKKFYNM